MTDKIYKFFPDPLFKYKLHNFEKNNLLLEKYIYDIYNKDNQGVKLSNINGWHSKPFNLSDPKSAPYIFFQNIKPHLIDVFDKYGWVFNEKKIRCEAMWAIINKKENFNVEHIHANCYLSAAYYVKVPKNSGKFQIHNPNHVSRNRFPIISRPTELNILKASLEVQEGELLIFPSYLPHSVGKNESEEDRIVVSFNLNIVP